MPFGGTVTPGSGTMGGNETPGGTFQKMVIQGAAQKYGIDPAVLWGVFGTESSFGKNPSASPTGARGPFQIEPGTARQLGVNPDDFVQAAHGAAQYLSQFKGRGLAGMLSAYNAGPGGGLQPDYVKSVLDNAKSWTGAAGGGGGASAAVPALGPDVGQVLLGRLFSGLPRVPGGNPLVATGLVGAGSALATGAPARQTGIGGQPAPGNHAAGLIPAGEHYTWNRLDQGVDIQMRPGAPLVADGEGVVLDVKSDPGGFGPAYPVVRFTSGPLAGQEIYLGHTDAAVRAGQRVSPGMVLAHTSRTGHNAPPGWVEVGQASALGQGIHNQGSAIAQLLGYGGMGARV